MNNPFRRTSRPGNVEIFDLEQQLNETRQELNAEIQRADRALVDRDIWRNRADEFAGKIIELSRRVRDLRENTDQKLARDLADMKALALRQEDQLAKDRTEIEDLEQRLAAAQKAAGLVASETKAAA